jgi:hypothetical protein
MNDAYKFYSAIARYINQIGNLEKFNTPESLNMALKVEELVENMVLEYLPRGSGFDKGTKINWDESNENKLVFETAFHHINERGYYNGWTEHKVIITPNLMFGFNIKIAGKNREEIKCVIHDRFYSFSYKGE